jgi:DNA polymerase III sliding clamp (beta) subunit (PCNA family)
VITSGLTEIWEWKTKIPVNVEWTEITIGINWKYILDFIKEVEGNQVIMNIVDSERPVVLKDIADDRYTYVVRPLVK